MKKRFLLFVILQIFACEAFAQEAEKSFYSVNELLEIAEKNSANIKSAQYFAFSQQRLANQQKYWNNPTSSFNRSNGQEVFSVSQSVPFLGKLQTKYDIENAEFQVLETRKNNVSLMVKAEVFVLLYQYQVLKTKIALAQKRLNRLALVDQYLSTIVLNSPTKRAQSYITKDRIKLVERSLIKFQNELYQTWNAANIYLNLKKEPEIIIVDWLDEKNYKGRKFLIDAAAEGSLDLKEQKLLLSKYKSELSFAKIEQMPDLQISASRQNNSSATSSFGNQGQNGIGLSLSIPLFNRNQEKILSAQSKIKAQELSFEFHYNRLIQMLSNDINEFETSLKLAKNFPVSGIDKTLARLALANSDFKKGVLDFITYIELDLQEYQIIDTCLDTQLEMASAYSRLMIKIGDFITP